MEIEQGSRCKKNCCSKIRNLGVSIHGKEILHSINLHLHCGELTVIIGPNGSGKTTLLKAISGEIQHTGDIEHHSADKENSNRLRIGYVPQKIECDPGSPMTVCDLFNSTLTHKPIWLFNNRENCKRITSALELMNAEHLINRKLCSLSGGELQRVLVALATIPVPDLLLLDEPVSGVDHSGLQVFYKAISNLRCKHDLSILMVSHDLMLSSGFADRFILLNKTILCEGTPSQVLQNITTRELMGFTPPLSGDNGTSPPPPRHHDNHNGSSR
ncbi:MAG TPA: metal ABC transporter ATP-binding protein [Chitinispirillaceae bacterium]|nr:metal ABC transporter ATP-binding protein [Chitinispirillaceae bacterium]